MSSPGLPRTLCLSAVATAVLATAGCGCPDQTERYTESHLEFISGTPLNRIRSNHDTDEERCEAACLEIAEGNPTEVERCEATSTHLTIENPWDTAVSEVDISCTTVHYSTAFCTGRRPLGHHETNLDVKSTGAWFAVHAHLEAASVTAFEELAVWLERREASAELVARCRAAATDEVRHATTMTRLARAEGVEPPAPHADPPADDLLSVALHNAVEGCVHEAFAAVVAAHQAVEAADPELRAVFETIGKDELRHGQLAWDLHAWLCQQLSPAQRRQIELAQQRALAELPATARDNARRTPLGLGWPAPSQAAAMARHFGALVSRAA